MKSGTVMNKLFLSIICLVAIALQSNVSAADLPGKWRLEVEPDLVGLLELRDVGGSFIGFVEGGPIEVDVDGNDITLVVDSRDQSMRRFDRILTGRIVGDSLQGTFVIEASGDREREEGSWRAVPWDESEDTGNPAPEPVSLAGMWGGASGRDLRKYRMDTTAQAEAFVAGYDANLDQPPMRCMSPGVVALFGAPYLVEIVETEDRILLFSESFMQARHIYLDGRTPPDYFPHSRLGFSVGHWEGSTLVIETTHIKANVRDYRGEPLSENARVIERYRLEDDGQTLAGVMTIHDPENYNQPPIRRTLRRRTSEVPLPYECDPDSFFRQLYRENQLDEYFSRGDRRL
jgi:hypothetical protein